MKLTITITEDSGGKDEKARVAITDMRAPYGVVGALLRSVAADIDPYGKAAAK